MNQELNPSKTSTDQKTKRLKTLFYILLFLGILGLLDVLSKPVVTPIVEEYFGKSLEGTQVTFLTAIYIDMARNGASLLERLFLESVLFLDGIWFLFFISAYFCKKAEKRTLTKPIQETTADTSNLNHGFKSKKENLVYLVGGVLGCLLGLWLLISMLMTGNFLFLMLLIGGGILYGGILLLKDFFKKLQVDTK